MELDERKGRMSIDTHVSVHEADPDLFQALARVFPPSENEGSRWVSFMAGDIRLTFFAPRAAPADPDAVPDFVPA